MQPGAVARETIFSRLFRKKIQEPLKEKSAGETVKESFFSRLFRKKKIGAKELPSFEPAERQKAGVPEIAHKSRIDLSKIMIFLILVALMLYLIIIQLVTISEKPSWYYILLVINIIALIALFYSAKYIFRKRKSGIEKEAEALALEKEQEEAVKSGKEMKRSKKIKLLRHFIRRALQVDFKKEQIIESAISSGWPRSLVEEAYETETAGPDIVEVLIKRYELNVLRKYMKRAIEQKYPEDIIIQAALNAGWPEQDVKECYDSLYGKQYLFEKEQEAVREGAEFQPRKEYLKVTATLIRHETDLDRLYDTIKKRGAVKLSEVYGGFKINKKQAEEWANILEKYGLIEIYYPVLGEPELRWKKSKATE